MKPLGFQQIAGITEHLETEHSPEEFLKESNEVESEKKHFTPLLQKWQKYLILKIIAYFHSNSNSTGGIPWSE